MLTRQQRKNKRKRIESIQSVAGKDQNGESLALAPAIVDLTNNVPITNNHPIEVSNQPKVLAIGRHKIRTYVIPEMEEMFQY
ncbi:hypothetical protein MP228_007551 [Amoeboaphelidium protococcarum]|nr:hypothetical protein MP228_007551 [Amoeboaphelidium protococcarum]